MRPQVILSAGQYGRMLAFQDSTEVISAATPAEIPGAVMALQKALDRGQFSAGWFSYEACAYMVQPELFARSVSSVPLLWFGVFPAPVPVARSELRSAGRGYAGPLQHEWDRIAYRKSFDRIQEHIAAGDIYQANLSFRSHFRFFGDPFDLYLRLYDTAQVPFSGYIDTGRIQVLSLSPELFFDIDSGNIQTQPMKGTAARGEGTRTDQEALAALASSAKNRAENVMIVDLMRNDLGRIANPGTVKVPELLGIRTYPTYHTMVSTINAELRSPVSLQELLSALMPAGSITGAPKLRAMQVLRDVETSAREIYCGAIGYMTPSGDASFNVAIRTLWLDDQVGKTGVGGAVVADSQSDDEYDECLLKARWYSGNRTPIGLIETLRWSSGFERLEKHLDRMAHSAKALSLPFDRSAAQQTLKTAVSDCNMPLRVRLQLNELGEFSCSTKPIGPDIRSWRYVVSPERVSSRDLLLAHKTTWRDLYDAEWDRWCANGDVDEVLFLNERGEITEGSRSNVFVRCGAQLLTPPASCGLLPGILRAELIEQSRCIERSLTLEDLHAADAIFLGNSLRGMISGVSGN